MGVGVRGDTGWTVAGVAESGVFTTLASIPAGGYADVYVNWTPVVSPSVALGRQFNYHSCIQIQIDPVAGEVVTSNQDGVGEQENIDVFELVRDFSTSLYAPTEGQFFVRNPAGKKTEFPFGPRRFRLHIDSQLPAGWTYEVGDGSDELTLDVDETRWIPVKISVPNDTPIGKSFDLKVEASTDYILQNDAMPESGFGVVPQVHHHLAPVSGLVLNAHTVIGSKLKLNAQATAGGWIYVSGQLDPQTQGILTLDFMNPQGTTYSQQVVTEKDGHFATTFIPPAKKQTRRVARQLDEQWSIRGIYQGNLTQSSTASELSIVTVTGAPQMYTLHLPVAIR